MSRNTQNGDYEVSGPRVEPPKKLPTYGTAISFAQTQACKLDARDGEAWYVRTGDGRPKAIVEKVGRVVETRPAPATPAPKAGVVEIEDAARDAERYPRAVRPMTLAGAGAEAREAREEERS